MEHRQLNPNGSGWLRKYTAMYLVIAVPLALCLLFSGKTFLWGTDAYCQQYTTLSYTGSVLRRLFSGEGFAMMEYALGQGMDSIGSLAYYGLTDPMQWLGAFFTGRALEMYYHFLVFLYIYLAGLFFCIYARKIIIPRAAGWQVALSGLIYTSCGYQTIGVIKNPYYAAGGIYLVLMLIAVERVLENRRLLMMSLVTLLMLMANFYLAYQTTLLAVLYIILRLAFRLKREGVKRSAGDGSMLLGAYLLGFGLSMVFLLPSVVCFLSSGRTGVSSGYTASLLHYPWAYYLKLAALFAAPYDYAGYWALQSFCPLALFAVMLLFMPGRSGLAPADDLRRRQIRAGYVLLALCLCIPLAGKLFNGLGYVTNRWSYGFAVMACIAAAWGLPRILDPEFTGRRKLAAAGFVWALFMLGYGLVAHKIPAFEGGSNLVAVSDFGMDTKNIAGLTGGAAVAASALCLWCMDKGLRAGDRRMLRIIAGLTVFCCLGYSVGYGFVAATSDEFKKSGIDRQIEGQTVALARRIEDDSFFRTDAGTGTDSHAVLLDYNGVGYYWSMIPRWVSGHYTDLQLSTQKWTFRLEGLGADTYLNALASVKYSLRKDTDTAVSVPYGFEQTDIFERSGGDVLLYENRYALPLGYVFDEVISREDYAALDPVAKRRALVSAALLEEGDCDLPACDAAFAAESLDWEVISADGVELDGNTLRGKAGGTITLRFEARPDSEAYLHLDGTRLLGVGDDTDLKLTCLTADGSNGMFIIYPDGNFNYDQQGVCMRLGYAENGLDECTLRFSTRGELTFDDLRILSIPMHDYRAAMEEIHARGLWEVKPGDDRIEGPIMLQNPGVLQISLPYSGGWTAYVDGQEAEILRCGGMYMGIALDAGEHQVELRYVTPGLRAGAWISGICVLLMAALYVLQRRRKTAI